MMYELFGFELSDFKGLFYVFCLAVLVYVRLNIGVMNKNKIRDMMTSLDIVGQFCT